jgi:hypothetical protein
MRVTRISVALEKRASDGDYGSERSEAELSAELEPGDDPMLVLEALQMQARGRVEHDLAQSPNLKVRQATLRHVRRCNRCQEPLPDDETGYMHAACRTVEDAEIRARRAEQEARYLETRRALEPAGVGEDDDDVVDDEDLPL